MVHLLPHWNWDNPELANRVMDEEGRIPVRAFSNAHSVELIVNGESQGVKTFTKKTTADGRTYQEGANPDELYLEWLVPYVPGKVEAIARNEAGEVIARDQIETAGKPAGVRLLKEEHAIAADGKDLTYITYEIVDEAGRVVPTANNLVHFHLHGQGQIVGVDNGEQASRERYKAQEDGSWQRRAFNGKGVVIVKSTEQAGAFTLYADSDRLQSDQVSLFTGKKDQKERSILGVEPVRTQVYLGAVSYTHLDVYKRQGVMDAKKALVEVDGDIEKAIELLREKGMAKAAKKADRVAAEGLTGVYVNGNVAAVVEDVYKRQS